MNDFSKLLTGIPFFDAVAMLIAFFVVGLLISIKTSRPIDLTFLSQLFAAEIMVRYLGSFWVYGAPLREGIWPVFWSLALLFGLWVNQRSAKK